MTFIWSYTSFCYYMLNLFIRYLYGDIFTNSITAAVADCTGIFLSVFILKVVGFKKSLSFSYFLSALGLFCMIVVDTRSQWWISVFLLTSKLGIGASFNLLYVGNYLLFPVSMLATSLGICNLFARMFTVPSSFVAELKPEFVPMAFYVVFNLFCMFLTLSLKIPEEKSQKNKLNFIELVD
jgi:hypothetical protein